jgi:hypothetical protein
MLGYSRWQLLKGLAVVVGTMSMVSLALIYFIPAPPQWLRLSKVFLSNITDAVTVKYSRVLTFSSTYARLTAQWKTLSSCRIQNLVFRLPLRSEASQTGSKRQDCCP